MALDEVVIIDDVSQDLPLAPEESKRQFGWYHAIIEDPRLVMRTTTLPSGDTITIIEPKHD